MILVSKTYWAGLPFWFRRAPDSAVSESLVLRAHDRRQLRAVYWSNKDRRPPRIGVVLIHPRVDFTHHYAIPRLLEAGFGVLAANTRSAANDSLTEHEEMVLDVDACVRHLKERRNVDKVVLFGNCGGASLCAYYQAEAQTAPAARTQKSPAGAPTHFDSAMMPPADAMVYVAAHRGQGKTLQDAIDPSVIDEADPLSVDPALDMYDPRNGFVEPPEWSTYESGFLARYRAAQAERVAKLDELAHAIIARKFAAKTDRERACEPMLVVYRTMANPTFVDRRLDPSDRDYGSLLSERPDLMNYALLGLGRTCSPAAWLSTWSGLSSKADLVNNVARITTPSLLVTPSRDREVLPGDSIAIGSAMASLDKKVVTVEGRHYFEPELGAKDAPDLDRMLDVVIPWIFEKTA